MKLTQEEEESLELLLDSGWWGAIEKVLAIGVEKHRDALLSQSATDPSALSLAKARLEGAQAQASLISGLKRKKREAPAR